MRIRLTLGLAAAAVVAGGAFVPAGGSASAADCSRATALRIGEPFFIVPASLGNPISQVLCGPFTGADTEAMAVSFAAPTCWGIQRWALFRFVGGEWQLVLDRKGFIFPLVAVGADIREKAPVFRPGDPRCLPSGGSRARLWSWAGTRFTPGPWRQVTPGAAAPSVPGFSGFFKLPSGNVVCGYGYGSKIPRAFVHCRIKSGLKPRPRPERPGCFTTPDVYLGATGRTTTGRTICPGEPEGDAGILVYEGVARVLGYGKTWSGGGLSCASAVTGLTCRNTSGHGFFLSRAHWRAF